MTTIEELLVVLKGDAREFDRAANEGVRLLTDLDQSAQKATKRLDDVWAAWSHPQSAADFMRNEMALQQAMQDAMIEGEKQLLRDKLARMEEESAAEYEKAEEMAAAEEARISAQQNDMATFQSWRVAEQQKEMQQTQILDNAIFNMTHSGYERRLRDMQQYYARQRAEHAGNLENLKKLDQLYFLEWRELERVQEEHQRRMLLARRGPLMLAARTILPQVTFLAGGQIGMMGMMMSQGSALGGLMAGVIAAGAIIKEMVGHYKAFKALQKDIWDYAEKTEKSYAHQRESIRETTGLGNKLRAQAQEIQARADEMAKRAKEAQFGTGGFSSVWAVAKAAMWTISSGQAMWPEVELGLQEATRLEEEAKKLREMAALETELLWETTQRKMWVAERSAEIQGMEEGTEKRRASLELQIRSRLEDVRARVDEELRLLAVFGATEEEMAEASARGAMEIASVERQIYTMLANFQRDEARRAAEEPDRRFKALNAKGTEYLNRIAVAKGRLTQTDVAWMAIAEELREQWNATNEELDTYHRLFRTAVQAEANKIIEDNIKSVRIEIQLLKGEITEADAALQHSLMAHPEAGTDRVKELHALQQQAGLIRWVKEELASLYPERILEEYTKRLWEAVHAGLMTQEEAAKLWESKRASIFDKDQQGLARDAEWKSMRALYVDWRGLTGTDRLTLAAEETARNTRPLRNKGPELN